MSADDEHLSLEDRKILSFMFANLSMSPREVARHFSVPVERIRDILARDLRGVLTGYGD